MHVGPVAGTVAARGNTGGGYPSLVGRHGVRVAQAGAARGTVLSIAGNVVAAEILEPALLLGQVEFIGEGGPIVVGRAVALVVTRPRIAHVGGQEVRIGCAIEQIFVDVEGDLEFAAGVAIGAEEGAVVAGSLFVHPTGL